MGVFGQIRKLKGDIVECGVDRGRSLITIASLNRLAAALDGQQERKILALDSFEGFPELTEFDESPRAPKKGQWSESPSSQFKYSPETISKVMHHASGER